MKEKISNFKKQLLKKIDTLYFAKKNKSSETEFLNCVANKLNNGIKMIVYFKTTETDKEFLRISQKINQLCSILNGILIIKDRIDIVQLINNEGILLDKNSISSHEIEKLVDKNKLFGYFIQDDIVDYSKFDFLVTNQTNSNIQQDFIFTLQDDTGNLRGKL